MTDQYGQATVNREGFRFVNQAQIQVLAAPFPANGVLLGADDKFCLLHNDGGLGYSVYMPNVSDCAGFQFTLKNLVGGVAVTIRSLPGQTFSGGGTTIATAAGESVILNGNPPTPPVAPAIVGTPPTEWSVIKVGAI